MKTTHALRYTPILIALAVAGGSTMAQDKKPPTVVVAKTEASSVASWQPAMGEGLAQMIITELTKLPNVKVLESVALDDLRAERALGESGEVAQSEAVKKGQWKGADYTFKTTVTRFGAKQNTYGGGGRAPIPVPFGGGGFSLKKSEHEVQIDWRIIDNATREIVSGASGRATGVEKGTGFNFSSWHGGGFSDNREFLDSALGKATMKAIAQLVEQVRPLDLEAGGRTVNAAGEAASATAALRNVKGLVKLVEGNEVWTSLGSNNGFNKGDKVKIYKPVEKKNKKGEVIATTYELVGEMVLTKVQKDKSVGQYSGSVEINEDWVVADSAVDVEQLE